MNSSTFDIEEYQLRKEQIRNYYFSVCREGGQLMQQRRRFLLNILKVRFVFVFVD
jgi:hypothetical protein